MSQKFGADPKSVEAMKKWSAAKGLTVENNSIDMRTGRICISGSKSTMEQAFRTHFPQWQTPNGGTARIRIAPYAVEKEMAPHFESMLGGDARPSFRFKHTGFT